jgi:hypothetical protein
VFCRWRLADTLAEAGFNTRQYEPTRATGTPLTERWKGVVPADVIDVLGAKTDSAVAKRARSGTQHARNRAAASAYDPEPTSRVIVCGTPT